MDASRSQHSVRRCRVRAATFGDTSAVYATLLSALEDAPSFYPPPEMPYALQYLMDLMAQGQLFVATPPNSSDVVGVIALDWAHWPWNRKASYLYNQHFWVEPIWRAGGTAQRLLQAAKALAQERGVPLLVETSMLDADTPRKDKFIEKNGFQRIGGAFILLPNQSM